MKYKINIKRRKKRKNQKNMAPRGFEPGSCGVRDRAPFHWAS
jgi:hypothetical protein